MSGNIHIVDGPPGTGKTHFLSRQCQRAADKHGVHGVAIASLTRAAATEIGSRVGIPAEMVGTLHAHSYRGLDRPDLAETPEGLRAWAEAHPSLALSGSGRKLEDAPDAGEAGRTQADTLHAQVATHRARLTPPAQWTDEQRDWHATWTDFKTQTRRLDFTDLIETAADELPAHPASPKVLLLDEAQDFSALEMRLALQWAAAAETTVIVGDDDQALYTWRGSDAGTLNAIPATGRRALEQSYRVPKAVHRAATRWISQLPDRRPVAYKPTEHEGRTDVAPYALRSNQLMESVSADLEAGRTVMVLATCSYMLTPLLHDLKADGVPFHNPYRVAQGQWNPMRGAGRLLSYLRPVEAAWGEDARAWTWGDLHDWADPLQAKCFTRGSKALIERYNQRDQFGTDRSDQEVPLEMLLDLLGAGMDLQHPALRLDTTWWQENLRAPKRKTAEYPLQVLERRGPAALRETPKLIVGTIHSVKGGEADSVYLDPTLSKQGFWGGWHEGGAGHDAIVRLMYVAATRARERLVLLQPAAAEHVHGELAQVIG